MTTTTKALIIVNVDACSKKHKNTLSPVFPVLLTIIYTCSVTDYSSDYMLTDYSSDYVCNRRRHRVDAWCGALVVGGDTAVVELTACVVRTFLQPGYYDMQLQPPTTLTAARDHAGLSGVPPYTSTYPSLRVSFGAVSILTFVTKQICFRVGVVGALKSKNNVDFIG